MHIGTGIFEGKVLSEPVNCTDRSCRTLTIKEEIFTVIGTRILEAKVLDVNDSNGMYGIESMSRGAVISRFVNPEKNEIKATENNLKIVGVDPKTLTYTQTINEFISNTLINELLEEKYDVIFFEVKAKDDFSVVSEVFSKQKPSGITVLIYPNLIGFELPKVKGGEVIETREFEDRKVAIFLKK